MAGLVVAVMVAAAISLLPAVIGIVGRSIDRWRVPRVGRRDRPSAGPGRSLSARWATTVARRSWVFAVLGVAVLLVLACPVLSMRLDVSDDGNLPPSTTQRQAYDLIAQGGLRAGNERTVARDRVAPRRLGHGVARHGLVGGVAAPGRRPGVATVTGATAGAGEVAVITVFPKTSPESEQTATLVQDLRRQVLPAAVGDSGARALVGGITTAYIDIADRISDRLPYFVGAVALLSFLLWTTRCSCSRGPARSTASTKTRTARSSRDWRARPA